jgi:hypothetical protein
VQERFAELKHWHTSFFDVITKYVTMEKPLSPYEPDDKLFLYLVLGVLSIVGGIYYSILSMEQNYTAIWIHVAVLAVLGTFATIFLKRAKGRKAKNKQPMEALKDQ